MEHVDALLKTTLAEIERVLTTKTVVGEPITIEGSTIVPLVSIGFGFGAGGSAGKDGKAASGDSLGAGSGGGGGIKPMAVVVVGKDGSVRIESVRRGAPTMVERVGQVIERVIDRRNEKSDKKA